MDKLYAIAQRHQLRVHMNALRLPIMGDQFYPIVKNTANQKDNFEQALQLLAQNISFIDPMKGVTRVFTSELKLAY
jgi:tRNA pseudouridine32 synthase/23S rRNA pseudouridine746 synthase